MKKGDTVECIDSKRAKDITEGRTYEILKYGGGVACVVDDVGEESTYFSDRFRVVTPPVFKPGDWVRYVGGTVYKDLTQNKMYAVLSQLEGWINVVDDDGDEYPYRASCFELAAQPAFKPGDFVRCVDAEHPSDITEGNVYHVLECGDNFVRIVDDAGDKGMFYSSRFELTAKPVFKPGDWVRCTDSKKARDITEGRAYEVVRDSSEHAKVVVVVDDTGEENAFRRWRFEPAARPAFKRGDWVRCIAPEGPELTEGNVYQVESTGPNHIRLIGDSGFFRCCYGLSMFEPTEAPAFSVGGRVRCINNKRAKDICYNGVYTVTKVFPDALVIIDAMGDRSRYAACRFEPVAEGDVVQKTESNCPSCDAELEYMGSHTHLFWCYRCGTLVQRSDISAEYDIVRAPEYLNY